MRFCDLIMQSVFSFQQSQKLYLTMEHPSYCLTRRLNISIIQVSLNLEHQCSQNGLQRRYVQFLKVYFDYM